MAATGGGKAGLRHGAQDGGNKYLAFHGNPLCEEMSLGQGHTACQARLKSHVRERSVEIGEQIVRRFDADR